MRQDAHLCAQTPIRSHHATPVMSLQPVVERPRRQDGHPADPPEIEQVRVPRDQRVDAAGDRGAQHTHVVRIPAGVNGRYVF